MGVPPNHPFLMGFDLTNHPFGVPPCMETLHLRFPSSIPRPSDDAACVQRGRRQLPAPRDGGFMDGESLKIGEISPAKMGIYS